MRAARLKKYRMPCQFCGEIVERAQMRDNATCFDCRRKLRMKTAIKFARSLKSNHG